MVRDGRKVGGEVSGPPRVLWVVVERSQKPTGKEPRDLQPKTLSPANHTMPFCSLNFFEFLSLLDFFLIIEFSF